MTSPVDIRVARDGDAALLAEIGRSTFVDKFRDLYKATDLEHFLDESHSASVYQSLIDAPDHQVWIAESGQAPIGYATAGPCKLPLPEPCASAGELQRIYVAEGHQGVGLGQRLYEECIAFLKQHFDDIFLGVYSENIGAQRFYQGRGFAKVGEYDFMVGEHADREWILQWRPEQG